jgi:uncharacterized protein YutD
VKRLRETARARHAEVISRIDEILGNSEIVATLQIVKNLPDSFEIESLNDQQTDALEKVTRSFDQVGF